MKNTSILVCGLFFASLWWRGGAAQPQKTAVPGASGEWSEPMNLAIVNSPGGEKGPCISPDGKRLYFSRDGHPENYPGWFNIWYSDWDGKNWGAPKNLGPEVNQGGAADPSITGDGKLMYFLSNRPRGYGAVDIWYSEWDGTRWGSPKNAGPEINTSAGEWTPTVSSDGNTLYFMARRREGNISFEDLWVARRLNGVWQKPSILSSEINTAAVETCPWLTLDGKEFYFARMIFDQPAPAGKMIEHHMWVCDVISDSLHNIRKVPGKINAPGFDACCTSITRDGKTMFFTSNRPGGKGSFDIWVSERR